MFPMSSVMLWNARGLNDGSRQQALTRLVQEQRPDLVFLAETKIDDLRLGRAIQQWLGFANCEFVPSTGHEGLSGGLMLLWSDCFQCDILGTDPNYMDVLIKPPRQHDPPWRFIGFYGFPASSEKYKYWALIRELADKFDYPRVIGGDFNEVMSRGEKEGGRVRRVSQMADFRAAFLYGELRDMGFVGDNPFTWTTTRIKERLDRVACNRSWLDRFPHSRVLHQSIFHRLQVTIILYCLRCCVTLAYRGRGRIISGLSSYGRNMRSVGLFFVQQIGDGSQIGVWFDRWILDFPATGPQLREDSRISLPYRVCDLMENGSWKRELVEALFAPGSAKAILRIPLSTTRRMDRLRWFP